MQPRVPRQRVPARRVVPGRVPRLRRLLRLQRRLRVRARAPRRRRRVLRARRRRPRVLGAQVATDRPRRPPHRLLERLRPRMLGGLGPDRASAPGPVLRGAERGPRVRGRLHGRPGDAPCVFTCCKGDAEALTATEVDRTGAVCWEAHANEGKLPVARRPHVP